MSNISPSSFHGDGKRCTSSRVGKRDGKINGSQTEERRGWVSFPSIFSDPCLLFLLDFFNPLSSYLLL